MKNVVFLGMVSFFADISSEMVYPIIPLYLVSAFGATPVLVGVIEGIAESLASLLKVFSGYFTDRYEKKKPVAFLGYSTGLIYKIMLVIASSWVGILGARVIDRIGKGIRTAPRDVMISECADSSCMGKAFGIHKAMDMAGSAIGILLAYLMLVNLSDSFDYKKIFLISMIPSLLCLVMFIFIKEEKKACAPKAREHFWENIKGLDSQLKLYLLVTLIFTLGNSSNAFLILRAQSTGFNDTTVILLYFLYNASASLLALPFGKRSDQVGRKSLLVSGYLVFSLVYFGFALAYNKTFMVLMFLLYGAYTAMISGVERALIAEIAPAELKGTMLGLHQTIVGIALLPASIIAGVIWNAFGAPAPFIFGGLMSLIAAFILFFFMKGGKPAAR